MPALYHKQKSPLVHLVTVPIKDEVFQRANLIADEAKISIEVLICEAVRAYIGLIE